MYFKFSDLKTIDKVAVLAFLIALALSLVAVIAVFVVRKLRPESESKVKNAVIASGVVYAAAFCGVMIYMTINKMVGDQEIFGLIFWPILAGILLVLVLVIAYFCIKKFNVGALGAFKKVAFGLILAEILASLVCLGVYYKSVEEYYEGVSQIGLYLGAVAVILVIAAFALFLGKKQRAKSDTKALAYGAISMALAFALSYVKLFRLPEGGSVTAASMLPIMIYSYMYGSRKGVALGFVYGLLQAVQDPWIIHPAQFLLDYPVAYCAVGLAGMIKDAELFTKIPVLQFVLGGLIAGVIRYACHVLSGALAFASYAPDGISPIAWGFLYNTVTLVDLAICLIAGGALMCSKSFRKVIGGALDKNK